MSQDSVSSPSTGASGGSKINPDPLVFFQTILVTMTNRPEVNPSIQSTFGLSKSKVFYSVAAA
jgi:hypothetical protein